LRNLAILSIEQQLTNEINFDIAIKEFANKKARKVTVKKIVVFISEIKAVLNFYTLLLFFPICHFCFLLNCYLQCLSILVGIESQWRNWLRYNFRVAIIFNA